MTPLAAVLLQHYDRHARVLPWRLPPGDYAAGLRPDPYRVWLSESMLQQTQVRTVIPYFERFLQAFPDVHALAAAPREQVFALWAGLGYYARAKNLHAGAQMIAEHHAGIFPQDTEALRAIPGIGPYTAAAVRAIAFNLPDLPVDGNVRRVAARLFADEYADAGPLAAHVPSERPADFAQALMDLGSGICTPRRPLCLQCPLHALCAAPGDTLPPPRRRPTKEHLALTAWIITDARGHVYAPTRPEGGLWGGTRGLPLSDAAPFADVTDVRRHPPFRHVLTHRVFDVTPVTAFRAHFPDAVPVDTPMPTLMRKALKVLFL